MLRKINKKISPDLLDRVKQFTTLLNLGYNEENLLAGEDLDDYILRIPSKPDRISVVEGFPLAFKTSLDYAENDTIEVALFKAAMAHDEKKFTSLVNSEELHPKIKNHVLSYSVQTACNFRDIKTVKFLLNNGIDITNLVFIDAEEGFEKKSSPIFEVLNGWCNRSFFDQDLIELLLNNGLDLSMNVGKDTVYFRILYSAPEEFLIKMLDRIPDLNEPQSKYINNKDEDGNIIGKIVPCSYLDRAVTIGHFKLALAMIENGAEIEEDHALEWLNKAVKHNSFEFVQYLFENEHITSLENVEVSEKLLIKSLLHKNYKMFALLVKKGANIEAELNELVTTEKDGKFSSEHIHAQTIFAQLIKQAPEKVILEVLRLADIDVNTKLLGKYSSSIQDSYLHIALHNKQYGLATKLVELGANVNLPVNGTTPIHIALDDGALEVVEHFVKNGADLSYVDANSGKSAFKRAIDLGNKDLANIMIENSTDTKKMLGFALADAIYLKDVATVKLLLSMGADMTSLEGVHYRAAPVMFFGTDETTSDSIIYRSPLIFHINAGNTKRVIELINNGAAVNPIEEDVELSEMLVALGANIEDLKMIWGQSPFIELLSHSNCKPATKMDLCHKLIESGADVNKPNNRGELPLVKACIDGEFVEYLVSEGADVNVVDEFGKTPLNEVIKLKSLKTLQLMLDAGADANIVNEFGEHPLVNAALCNWPEACKLLLDARAAVNFKHKDNGKSNILFWAAKNYKCAKIIVESGKLKLDEHSKRDVKIHGLIVDMINFEKKALEDIKAIQTAYSECNPDSIESSFIPKKAADAMLKYYAKDYKSVWKHFIDSGKGKFFADLSEAVVQELKVYTMYNWPQTYDIARDLVPYRESVYENALYTPKEIIGEIGEYMFWLDVHDINS